MKNIKALTLDDVKKIAVAAETEARANGWAVSIAVCDAGGHGLWLQRMDGAPLMSAQVAPEKARTCVLTGKASKAFEDMVNNGRIAALAMPVVPLEGGEPIIIDDVEYHYEDMTDEQKTLVNHVADLEKKMSGAEFNLDQLRVGKSAFINMLSESLKD